MIGTMELTDAISKIIKIVKDSDKISEREKFGIEHYLNKADRALEAYNLEHLISGVKYILKSIENPKEFPDQTYSGPIYKDILEIILKRLNRDKRCISVLDNDFFPAFDDYKPVTFRRILRALGEVEESDGKIILTPKDPNLLQRHVSISEDDGMGYCPKGSNKVFDAYQENDDDCKDIKLWV